MAISNDRKIDGLLQKMAVLQPWDIVHDLGILSSLDLLGLDENVLKGAVDSITKAMHRLVAERGEVFAIGLATALITGMPDTEDGRARAFDLLVPFIGLGGATDLFLWDMILVGPARPTPAARHISQQLENMVRAGKLTMETIGVADYLSRYNKIKRVKASK